MNQLSSEGLHAGIQTLEFVPKKSGTATYSGPQGLCEKRAFNVFTCNASGSGSVELAEPGLPLANLAQG